MAWTPVYVTSDEVKAYLRITDTDDDAMVDIWAETASRAVDAFCGRQFGKVDTAEERTFVAEYDRHLGRYVAAIDDVQDVTGFAVADAGGTAVNGYVLGPVNASVKGRPYERMTLTRGGEFAVTALWGWSAVPVPVKQATLIQAARFAARRDSPFGIAGSPSEGGEMRLLATLDPDLKTALGRQYRRAWWAA